MGQQIERFTKDDFEKALPVHKDSGQPLWVSLVWVKGEAAYRLPVDDRAAIEIRSSVQTSGYSAGTGKDSIRCWLINSETGKPLGSKVSRWITRLPGWRERMTNTLRALYTWRKRAGDCPTCDQPRGIYKVKKDGDNHGRPFASCRACGSGFVWLDEPATRTAGGGGESTANAGTPPPAEATPPSPSVLDQIGGTAKATIVDTNEPVVCPTCGAEMRERNGKFGPFWGCSNYPQCKKTLPRQENKKQQKRFDWSKYQLAIFDFIQNGTGHAVIEAVAGSGKTTTNVGCLEFTDPTARVGLVAFNVHIAKAQGEKAPDHVRACTLHSLGLSNIKSTLGECEVDPRKTWNIINAIYDTASLSTQAAIDDSGTVIVKLVSMLKATMLYPSKANMTLIIRRYGILVNGEENKIMALARVVFFKSIGQTNVVDYDDMIYFSAAGIVPCERFDFLIVDEAQDLNKAQIEMALKSVNEAGRIICTGDKWQSIYGFRGADADAIPNIIEALSPKTLPLSISYRCSKAVVRLVNMQFPHIDFEAAENAIEGSVSDIYSSRLIRVLRSGDLVLCRTNAPLVRPAFDLIKDGQKAVIRGRDIGVDLIGLIEKMEKRFSVSSIVDLIEVLTQYERKEVAKLQAANKTHSAANLRDQVETIIALADGVNTIAELKWRTKQVFSDKDVGVVFSSVHRAKGDEADRVFILKSELMPHPMAKQPWELQQEENIRYVAYTRAKVDLFFVQD